MAWDLVITGVLAELNDDDEFVALIGGEDRIWPLDQTRAVEYDCVEWYVPVNTEGEVLSEPIISFDIRMVGTSAHEAQTKCANVERRFKQVVFGPYALSRGDIRWRAAYDDGRTMPVVLANTYARQVDGRFWIVKDKYRMTNILTS
jgi:hypothetical protein